MQPEIESPKPTPPPTPSRWEGWPTVGFGAAIFAVYFVAQSLVAVIFAVILALRQFLANPGTDILQLVASLSTNGLLISVATIVSAIVGVGFIILFIKLRKGASIKGLPGIVSDYQKDYFNYSSGSSRVNRLIQSHKLLFSAAPK